MARRTKTPSKRTDTENAASFELLEPVTAKAPRPSRKTARAPEPAEPAETEVLFPDVDTASGTADQAPAPPVKARRGRKPKASPSSDTAASARTEDGAAESAASTSETEQPDMLAGSAASSPPEPLASPEPPADEQSSVGTGYASASAASWNPATGTVTFDWPNIENVAAMEGPNQAMARLLLAARAEGANSRWPFSPTTSG